MEDVQLEILKDDERLDYLLAENLRIIQSPSVFSFSLDAYCLQDLPMFRFVREKSLIFARVMEQFLCF